MLLSEQSQSKKEEKGEQKGVQDQSKSKKSRTNTESYAPQWVLIEALSKV